MSDDPWSMAGTPVGTTTNETLPASGQDNLMPQGQDGDGYDPLMGGGGKLPSLITKEHGIGVKRSGVITETPKERQAYEPGANGKAKFWDEATNSVTTVNTGNPLMDTVFVLQTDYRMTPAELAAKEMDEDTGLRGIFAGGELKRAIVKAIGKTSALRGKPRSALVGYRITVWKTGTRPSGKANDTTLYEAELSR